MHAEPTALTILGTAICIYGLRFIYQRVFDFPKRTAGDVVPFLRKLDMEAIYGTFHPDVEDTYRSRMSARDFKAWQWRRIHLAIHYCSDMLFNCRLFLAWIRSEREANWNALPNELQTCIHELKVACVQCRIASFMIRSRLRLYLLGMALLPFLEPPSFKHLLNKGSSDVVTFYETAKILAESFSLAYGDEFHREFVDAVGPGSKVYAEIA